MGKPGFGKGAPRPKWVPKGQPSWMEATAARLEAKGSKGLGKGKSTVPEDTQMAAAMMLAGVQQRRRGQLGIFAPEAGGGSSASSSTVPVASIYETSVQMHRSSTGILVTGFEPQRHAFYVLGRPVQVCME